jgi:hypothetical protein
MCGHQNAPMRTTIDFPEDLYHVVLSLATHRQCSLSQTAIDLMRRGLQMPVGQARVPSFALHPVTGLPVLSGTKPIESVDVKALNDEE